ncbi:MAG: hypothetical protein JW958_12185 [Candidatus Eisenbacteria bacterium]|nr:hypothetical protein [Candidatus Eisenbacteria bacterium]
MRPAKWRRLVSVLCSFLLVAHTPLAFVGCGSGGEDTSGVTDTGPPSLSAAAAEPLGFLTVSHGSIRAGSTVAVEFRGAGDYLIHVETSDTDKGSAKVVVPPFIDMATGLPSSGKVTVAIGDYETDDSLTILPLPTLDGVDGGEVLLELLHVAVAEYEDAEENLEDLYDEAGGAVNVDTSLAFIGEQIAVLERMIEQIEEEGALDIELESGVTMLTADQLSIVDRLIAASLRGIAEELEIPNWSSTRSFSFQRTVSSDEPLVDVQVVVDEIKDRGVEGGRAYLGMFILTCTIAGFLVGGPVGGVIGASLGLYAAWTGAALDLGASALTNENSEALLTDEEGDFTITRDVIDQVIRVGSQFASGLSGLAGRLGNVISNWLTYRDTAEALDNVMNGENGDGDNGDGDGNGDEYGTYIHVAYYVNTDGTEGMDPGDAQIFLTGNPVLPTINWTIPEDVLAVGVLVQPADAWYAITCTNIGTPEHPVYDPITSPLLYGDYTVPNTEVWEAFGVVTEPTRQLLIEMSVPYEVWIATIEGKYAKLLFQIRRK